MRKLLETGTKNFVSSNEDEASLGEERVLLRTRDISYGDQLIFGKDKLTYSQEVKSSTAGKRTQRKIRDLVSNGVLPEDCEVSGDCFINEKDGGKFTGLCLKGNPEFFVKFRSLHEGKVTERSMKPSVIVTSQCIFGANGVTAMFEDGGYASMTQSGTVLDRRIVDVVVESRISLYELEALYRVVAFINALAMHGTSYQKVLLTTPLVSYYLYGLSAYEQGALSPQLMLKWFDAVDGRSDRISRLVSERVTKKVKVEICSPLDELRLYLRTVIQAGKQPELSDALSILSNQDAFYRELLEARMPASWLDLSENISISVEELRHSFETGEGAAIVKSPKQETTLTHSLALAKSLAPRGYSFDLYGMYLQEQVIVSHDSPRRASLYHVPEPIATSGAKEIMKHYGLLSVSRL